MTEAIITMIYPANITAIWNEVEPLLEPAVAHSGTHDCLDVFRFLMGGRAQLWVQWNGRVEAAVVTEFKDYPKGIWFNFWLAGALKGASVLWQKFFDTLYEYAKENRCEGIEDCGRTGWDKYAPQAEKICSLRRIKIGK